MTDTMTPTAQAEEHARASELSRAVSATAVSTNVSADISADDAHGMRPIALAFMAGNAAVLAVFALVVATGHLDAGGLGEVLLTTATAAPTN